MGIIRIHQYVGIGHPTSPITGASPVASSPFVESRTPSTMPPFCIGRDVVSMTVAVTHSVFHVLQRPIGRRLVPISRRARSGVFARSATMISGY